MNEGRPDDIAPALIELLAWYGEAGADSVLDEVPTDWRDRREGPGAAALARMRSGELATVPVAAAPPAGVGQPRTIELPPKTTLSQAGGEAPRRTEAPAVPASRSPIAPPATGERRFPTTLPDDAEAGARRLAATAVDLAALRQLLEKFDGCALKATATSLCLYRGAARARLMIIGEAPGRDEDLAGKPFVGRAGQMLDRMLAAIGLAEDDVHITNVVYWRPPGNRTPTPQETLICRPFLERQIELVAPEIVLTLGGPAAHAMLGGDQGILRMRGRWQDCEIGGRRLRVMPTLHPAYLLRTPVQKRLVWRDLVAVKLALEGDVG
ncbi:MAG: uracil-DNA glycosylase family protein [Hyphomicrobiaceae bacterium]